MSSLLSRVAVAAAGLPDRPLRRLLRRAGRCSSVVAVVAVLALHELYRMARALRPLVLAGYARRGRRRGRGRAGRRRSGCSAGSRSTLPPLVRLRRRLRDPAVDDGGGRDHGPRRRLGRASASASWSSLRDLEPDGPPGAHHGPPRPSSSPTRSRTSAAASPVGTSSPRSSRRARPGKASWRGVVGGILTTWIALYEQPVLTDGWEPFVLGAAIVLAADDRRPLRVDGEARPRRQGLRPRAPRPRRRPRPDRLAALRRRPPRTSRSSRWARCRRPAAYTGPG